MKFTILLAPDRSIAAARLAEDAALTGAWPSLLKPAGEQPVGLIHGHRPEAAARANRLNPALIENACRWCGCRSYLLFDSPLSLPPASRVSTNLGSPERLGSPLKPVNGTIVRNQATL